MDAVDLDQRPLAEPAADRDHEDGAVAEPMHLGDLLRVALGVADDDLAGRVRLEQPSGGGDLLEPRVAGACVVERHPRAARTQPGQDGLEGLRGGERLVLGELDHDVRQHLGAGP